MSKKTRLVRTTIYVMHDQIGELVDQELQELESTLKEICSRRNDGKNCVSILRVVPVLASSNTVEVDFTAFNEDIDFIGDGALEEIANIIDQSVDIEISHMIFKQNMEQIMIMGDLS